MAEAYHEEYQECDSTSKQDPPERAFIHLHDVNL